MFCSAGMMIINKLALKEAPLPLTIVLIQMAFTVLFLLATPCSLHFGSVRDVMRWALTIPWLFAAMLATSMLALKHTTMGAVVRNVAPIISLVVEGSVTKEKIEQDVYTVGSLVVILGGVLLYIEADVFFSPLGLFYMVLNMIFGVSERLLQRKMIAVDPIDVSKTGMMLLNNTVSLLPIGLMIVLTGEYRHWRKFYKLEATSWLLLLLSCVNAVGISWAGINCQAYVTATTFMVLGNLNKFLVIAFGMVVLHESKSVASIVGCCVALGGGVIYARARANLATRGREYKDMLIGK